jgi:hypothetical protein
MKYITSKSLFGRWRIAVAFLYINSSLPPPYNEDTGILPKEAKKKP